MKYDTGLNVHTGDWLRLNFNENLFLPTAFLKKMFKEVVDEIHVEEMPDTNCTAIKERLAKEHGVLPENIFIGNGGDEVIESLFFVLRKKYSSMNVPRISFKMYGALAEKYDFRIDHINNLPVLHPKIDMEEIKAKKGLFFIDSPSSLTGLSIDKEILPTLLDNNENFVVWDNVHGEYNREPVALKDNLVTIRHFTHFYGLNALRIGYCVGPKEVIEQLDYYRQPFSVNSMAQAAAIKCLDNKEYFYEVLKDIESCKKTFSGELAKLGFDVSLGGANFVMVQHPNVHASVIHKALADQKIATRHFKHDEILKDYLRMTVSPEKDIQRVTAALKEIINGSK